MAEQEQTYIKGFNDGYKMAKFQPDLVEKLLSALSEDVDYERGLIAGIKEYQQEKEKGRADDLNKLRDSKDQSQDKDLSR